jgi:hypothetical protein
MFSYCNLKFGLEELKNSISENNYPKFEKLNKVIDASEIFYTRNKSGICALNKKFMLMGSPSGCKYYNATCSREALEHLYIPKDIF